MKEQTRALAEQIPISHSTRVARPASLPRGLQLLLCAAALLWAVVAVYVAGDAAQGIALRLQVEPLEPLVTSIFAVFLLLVGFRAIDSIAARGRFQADVLRLPARASRGGEWGTGAAIGWGLALAVVLPIFASGHLHGRLIWQPGSTLAVVVAMGTVLFTTLAEEIVFRGYPFQRLSAAIGESWAAVTLSLVFAVMLVYLSSPGLFAVALVNGVLFGLLLTMAYLRTHALWAAWGLHFVYRAVLSVVLGLPVAGHGNAGSLVELYARGPHWLTGGSFGPDAAVLTVLAMLAAMALLYRATREFAWAYTHAPIVAGGYEVAVAPPPAHVAMEKAAPAPPPLVQILPVTPRGAVMGTPVEDLAQDRTESD